MSGFWPWKGPSTTSSAPHAPPGRKAPWQGVVVSRAPLQETNRPAARARDWAVCWPPARCSWLPGQAWPSALGPVRRWRQHPRGAAPPHLHPQRTWTHPPMLRSTSYLQMAHRMKCWAPRGTDQQNHPGTRRDVRCMRSKRSVGTYPAETAPTVTLRSPRAPAGGPLLEPERPTWVAAEGANPFRKERRDRSEIMLIRPQQVHESSTNTSSACWKPRHWRQRSCPSSADRKWPQPEGNGWNGILKKTRSSVICSFRICSFSWSAQGNRCWEGLRWLHRDVNQEQIRDERLVEISTLLIHSAPKQKSNEWMHLSPFYTRMHGEWLRYAKSSSQFHWRFKSQRWSGLPGKSPYVVTT